MVEKTKWTKDRRGHSSIFHRAMGPSPKGAGRDPRRAWCRFFIGMAPKNTRTATHEFDQNTA